MVFNFEIEVHENSRKLVHNNNIFLPTIII